MSGTESNAIADQNPFSADHSTTYENLGRVTGVYERAGWTPTSSDAAYFRYQGDIFSSGSQAQAAWTDGVSTTKARRSGQVTDCTSSFGLSCQIVAYAGVGSDGVNYTLADEFMVFNQCLAEIQGQWTAGIYSNYQSTLANVLNNVSIAAATAIKGACAPAQSPPVQTPTATPTPSPTRKSTTAPPAAPAIQVLKTWLSVTDMKTLTDKTVSSFTQGQHGSIQIQVLGQEVDLHTLQGTLVARAKGFTPVKETLKWARSGLCESQPGTYFVMGMGLWNAVKQKVGKGHSATWKASIDLFAQQLVNGVAGPNVHKKLTLSFRVKGK